MRVTEVKVFPVKDEKLKAFVSVVLDRCFMVNDIKVIEGRDGRFISMPSRRKRNGKFKDIAHPLNSETRQMLEQEILSEYQRVLNGDGGSERSNVEVDAKPATAERREAEEAVISAPIEVDESQAGNEAEDSSLEEVTEKHLSDTFWTS